MHTIYAIYLLKSLNADFTEFHYIPYMLQDERDEIMTLVGYISLVSDTFSHITLSVNTKQPNHDS